MKKFLFLLICLFSVAMYSCGDNEIEEEEEMEDNCEGTSFTYTNAVKAIVDSNCALSGCHVAGGDLPDYTSYDLISSAANSVASRTRTRSMPPARSGRSLTDEQIKTIKCWVEDGAPE